MVVDLFRLTCSTFQLATTHQTFICASSSCEQFSVHGMKHFHPNPPYPELGIKLFNHTRQLCEASGVPYVMENVRAAQQFVGNAVHHCGPFYLWGSGVPAMMPQGITKGMKIGGGAEALKIKRTLGREALKQYRREHDVLWQSSKSEARKAYTAQICDHPPRTLQLCSGLRRTLVGAESDVSA